MGTIWSTYKQLFPSKPTYSIEQIPDQQGKVVLITGGTSGIGLETARVLLACNAKVYITARTTESARKAVASLQSPSKSSDVHSIVCDLADLTSTRVAAQEFLSKERRLDILFNNAGVMFPPLDEVTKQGYDLQFGVHVVGYYYLSKLLLPALKAAGIAGHKARIVNMSSMAQAQAPKGGIDFATLKDGPARMKMNPVSLYQQSKAGTIVLSNAFARRYGDQGIISVALNPGNIRTGLQRHITGIKAKILDATLYDTVLYGILTPLYAGTAPEVENMNGKYFIPFARIGSPRSDLMNEALDRRLWDWLERETKGYDSY